MMPSSDKTKKIATAAVLATTALCVFVVEAQIPPIVPLPGIKLGLANFVTLVTMELLGKRSAFAVTAIRVVLGSIFTGSLMSLLYSAIGGMLSFAVMCVLHGLLDSKKLWAVSVFGAMAHNVGQLIVAAVLLGFGAVIGYLPVLTISAVICGAAIGVCAQLTAVRVKEYIKFKK